MSDCPPLRIVTIRREGNVFHVRHLSPIVMHPVVRRGAFFVCDLPKRRTKRKKRHR